MTRAEGDPAGRAVQEFDLDALLEEARLTCAADAVGRGIDVRLSAGVQRPFCGDREMVRWAVENVVRNAVRYSPADGVVEIRSREKANSAMVTVRDYGPGAPEDALGRICDPFYRVEESRSGSTGGLGLGLSIARRAVSAHHGTIAAENVSPGLRVTIELPL